MNGKAHLLAVPYASATALRERITADYRCDETGSVLALAAEARLSATELATTQQLATTLAEGVRASRTTAGGVDALMLEFSLESREGIALMCLAEALLRIPDAATRDRLIRDKIAQGDWRSHIGRSPSLFVNAAAWGLLVTGKLVDSRSDSAMEQALASLLRKGGEPLIRKGVDLAMRLLGKQFVTGRTIDEALVNARPALFQRLRNRDPRDRQGQRRRRHLCRTGHLDQAVGAAPAFFPWAARQDAGGAG